MKKILFLFNLLFMAGHSQVNLASGLNACYALNGNATEPINNLTGTLSSVTSTVNRFNTSGSAIYLNGSSTSYMVLADNPLLKPSNAISFSCWINTPTVTNQYILFTKNSLASYFEAYVLCTDPGMNFMTRKGGPNGMDMAISNTTLSANTWYHLVTTIDNSFVKLYVNGLLEASTPSTFTGFDYVSGKKVFLGTSNEPTYDTPFTGTIDNARFYDRTLTAAEVSALYTTDPTCIPVITGITPGLITDSSNLIYPNPAEGIFKMENTSGEPVQVFDLDGRPVHADLSTSGSILEINISNLAPGIYILETPGGLKQKLIKQ